ncbi:hypothetical protein [Streptomyces sp. NPDC001652]|uniref:hypothetical protein n=1 Tax=Streptomyces sp. NPDC001652 TaxID=3154393 RepID=UPI0033318E26
MKYVALSLATVAAVAVGGLAYLATLRLLSTESTSAVGSTGSVSRAEVEKQVRENYSLPLVRKTPKSVSRARRSQAATARTKADGHSVSYDYAVPAD